MSKFFVIDLWGLQRI